MEEKYKKELFDLFIKNNNNYDLHKLLLNFIDELILDYVCKNKSGEYQFLSKLLDSINNAGHEKRRSEDIDKISKKNQELLDFIIENKRESFLP